MGKALKIELLLKNGSTEWNRLRKAGRVATDHTGATFENLFSANTDLSGLVLVGTEWDRCDLSKVSFRDADLSNAYFHGGRLQDCDFRGANLEGATFERLKLLRCDFSGALGLEALELDDVDMDRVHGLDGEEAPPPPPPPVHGSTSFTREQRQATVAALAGAGLDEPPPFQPQDPPGTLLYRGLKRLGNIPPWVLDVPGLRPPLPLRLPPGPGLESLLRDAVKQRLEGSRPVTDPDAVKRAQNALRLGSKEAPFAVMYLREVGVEPAFRFSAANTLREQLKAELEVDDLTGAVDPRVVGALWELRLPRDAEEALGEVRRRLAATQLFEALLEAGFNPENNWEEAVDAHEAALDLVSLAVGEDRERLTASFSAHSGFPEEARLRRLAYLAESATHLEQLARLPSGTEPEWLQGPEFRECHDREMLTLQAMSAEEVPKRIPELAQSELGVAPGSVPEDSEGDLFIHLRCAVCGKEKLIVQTPET
jgi:Pentapeptide repeats (8 copies)